MTSVVIHIQHQEVKTASKDLRKDPQLKYAHFENLKDVDFFSMQFLQGSNHKKNKNKMKKKDASKQEM